VDPSGYEHVYVTDEGLNDDGEYWYCVYSDKAHNNLIAIVTGADNLASRYSDFDIEDDRQSMTSQLNTPAYQTASAYSYVSGESIESVFFGGSDFGITVNVDNVDGNNNRNTILTYIAMGFVLGAEFNESGIGTGEGGISGFSGHAVDQAINRHVSPFEIKDSVMNPISIKVRPDLTVQYWGKDTVVVFNQTGRIVTVWSLHSGY
jgi:hypothetical protein